MKMVILAGYRPDLDTPASELEARLKMALQFTPEPIVVVAESTAELLLRSGRSIERCDLVYDTHAENANAWTNTKAGLIAAQGPALVQAIESNLPSPALMNALKQQTLRRRLDDPEHMIQLLDSHGAILGNGFPLGVTHAGFRLLSRVKDVDSLTAKEINYSWLKVLPDETVLEHDARLSSPLAS